MVPVSDAPNALAVHQVPAMFPDPSTKLSSAESMKKESLSVDVFEVESQNVWDGNLEDEIPEKDQPKPIRNLRHIIFTVYHRLFGVVFVTNMAVFIAFFTQGRAKSHDIAQIVLANIFCSILMRQDHVINALFNIFCAVPTSWPLTIRRICGRVYHIGGVHSGCAISGIIWLILFAVQATREFVRHDRISVATLAITYVILILLIIMVIFAYPAVRSKAHNSFEMTHRFIGWTVAVLVWCKIVLIANDNRGVGQSLWNALIHSPSFWMNCVTTVSLILPWFSLRKYAVRSVILSDHAIRVYFDYATPVPGSFVRVCSENLLVEWHAFAAISEPEKKGFSIVVSRAGDWTSKQIADPPAHLWVRGVPTCGVMRIVPIFRRVLLVATGSGIGPCAPHVFQQRVPIRLLWIAPNVRKTFGDELVDSILERADDAIIYDTRTHGKPDIVKLTYQLAQNFNAEAVCIISNRTLTEKVVYGMVSRGMPAFGAIWDS